MENPSHHGSASDSLALESSDDSRRMRRLLANRIAAQKYREKKDEYVKKLERDVFEEETNLSNLMTQAWRYKCKRIKLVNENNEMKQELQALANEKAFKEAKYEELKKQRDELMLLYKQQQEQMNMLKP